MSRILDSTPEAQARKHHALKLLGWLAWAKRPLKWREIQGAMSIDLGEEQVKQTRRMVIDPLELCSSFVECRSDQSVDLVHSTAWQ